MARATSSITYLSAEPCCRERNWPKERGPTETLPGRKAGTDRVCERISEGFRLAESGRVAPRGHEANDSMAPPPHSCEGTGAADHALTQPLPSSAASCSLSATSASTEKSIGHPHCLA